MVKTINLTGEKKKQKAPNIALRLSPEEVEMLDDIAKAYQYKHSDGSANEQGMIRYMIRSVFALLADGRKI